YLYRSFHVYQNAPYLSLLSLVSNLLLFLFELSYSIHITLIIIIYYYIFIVNIYFAFLSASCKNSKSLYNSSPNNLLICFIFFSPALIGYIWNCTNAVTFCI